MKIKTFNYLWKIVIFPFMLIKTAIMRVVNAVKRFVGFMFGEWIGATVMLLIILITGSIVIIGTGEKSLKEKENVVMPNSKVNNIDLIGNFKSFGKDYDESWIYIVNEVKDDYWEREFYVKLIAERDNNGESIEIKKEFTSIVDLNNYLISNEK